MKHSCIIFAFILFSLLMCNRAFCSDRVGASAVDPKVDQILRHMGDFLKTADQYTFRSHSTYDKVLASGQKIQYGEIVHASVRRPDRLHADIKGDLINQRFWYDGKSITMLDTALNIYANADSPADIDSTLSFAADHFGIVAPLADMVFSDPYADLIQNVTSGIYVGLHHINDVKCHHLAFTQENLDWQIWIEDSRMQVPRKLVITYKQVEGTPQYTALLSDWNFSPHLPDSVFTFVTPINAEEIEFLPLEQRVPEKIN